MTGMLRGSGQHLSLEVDYFGHGFEHDLCAGKRGSHIRPRHHRRARDDVLGIPVRHQSKPRHAGKRLADFGKRLGLKRYELLRGSLLDVNHDHAMPGIGKRHRYAAAHTARAEAGDRSTSNAHRANPPRKSDCNSRWPRLPRPRPSSVRPPFMKFSPQIAPPTARKALASGVATPASSAAETRNDRPRRKSSRM